MELHVPDAAHGLDLGLEGAEVIVVSVVTALKQVLVASVSRVLVTHPPERDMISKGHGCVFIIGCPCSVLLADIHTNKKNGI